MKVMEDREIVSHRKETGLWVMSPGLSKRLIRKLVEEGTFQLGFERALQAFGISKEDYEKL